MKLTQSTSTRRRALVAAAIVTTIASVVLGTTVLVAGTALGAQESSTFPLETQTSYLGTSVDSDHAVSVSVRVAPATQTLINGTVRITATDAAYISETSVNTTVSTTQGEQVLSHGSRPGVFHISRLEPSETVTIQLRVYPEALVPQGETLVRVDAEAQQASDRQVVDNSAAVAPEVRESAVGVVSTAERPTALLVGGGLLGGGLAVGVAGAMVWRSKRQRLKSMTAQIETDAMNAGVQKLARTMLAELGVDPAAVDDSATGTQPGASADRRGDDESSDEIQLTIED